MSMPRLNDGFASNVSAAPLRAGAFAAIGLEMRWSAAAAFVCGATQSLVINLVGELFVGELLLMQFAFLLLLLGRVRALSTMPALGIFLQTAVVMLLGYFISDIYRGAHPGQFLRGWAKIVLVILDFLALVVIAAHDKRNLWWFVLGMAIGGVCDLLVREVPITTVSGWKSGYGEPLAGLLVCLSCFVSIKIAAVALLLLGVVNIAMDFRILGAICIFVAAILWIRASGVGEFSVRRAIQVVALCALAMGIAASALILTQDEYSARREQSNAGRGAAIAVAAHAITESPLIGYGSWPMDARLVSRYHQQVVELGGKPEGTRRINTFVSHSQILQGWVEGGVLGVLFWLFYGCWLVRAGWYVAVRRRPDAYLPVFLFFLIYDFWHLFMSPFAGYTRILIAVGVAVICICSAETRTAQAAR